MPYQIPDTTVDLIRSLWEQGVPAQQIADQAKCSLSTVEKNTRDMPRHVRVTPTMHAAICTALDQGHKPAHIARTMGMHITTVRRHGKGRAEPDQPT